MKCCHYNEDQRAQWQPTPDLLFGYGLLLSRYFISDISTDPQRHLMLEQQWTRGSAFVHSDMGNKQTIFTAQQLDTYQAGVTPV